MKVVIFLIYLQTTSYFDRSKTVKEITLLYLDKIIPKQTQAYTSPQSPIRSQKVSFESQKSH